MPRCAEQVVSASPVACALFDQDMRYMAWSEPWMQLYGLGGRDLKGLCHYDVFPDLPERWRQAHRRGLAGETFDCAEDVYTCPDGSTLWVRWSIRPIRDPQGRTLAIALFTEDITARKQAETAVMRGNHRLEQVGTLLGIGVFEFDFQSETSMISDGYLELLGLDRSQVPQSTAEWTALLRPKDLNRYFSARRAAMNPSSDGRFTCEVHPIVRGQEKVMQILATVQFSDTRTGRRPERLVGILVDQTSSWQLQQALSRAQRLETVGKLAGVVAHDFNNILTVIEANLELSMQQTSDERLHDHLSQAMSAAQMGAAFNRRLLALAGGHGRPPVPLLIDSHISRIWELFQRVLNEDVELRFVPGAKGAVVSMDDAEFDAAILNVIVNARDAQPEGGRITLQTSVVTPDDLPRNEVRSARHGRFIRICVSDQGAGMSPATLAHAGELFFSTKTDDGGTGLGLASVLLSVERASGFVDIASEPGKGTDVSIYLPLIEGQTVTVASDMDPPQLGNGELVLVVEDDALVREATLKRLEALGYSVLEAGNADAALRMIEVGEPVQLVFSDVVMPGSLSGYDLVATLQDRHPGIGVLLCSGHVSQVVRKQGSGVPEVPMLRKPYSLNELADAVATALGTVRR